MKRAAWKAERLGRAVVLVALLGIFVLCGVGSAYAQYQDVIQQRVSVSRRLAGHAVIAMSHEPAKGARVEIYSSDWRTVLASTTTDEKGYFSFDQAPKGRVFQMQLSAPGLDPYRLRVRLSHHARHELVIVMVVAT